MDVVEACEGRVAVEHGWYTRRCDSSGAHLHAAAGQRVYEQERDWKV
jgi:hypothetical protein